MIQTIWVIIGVDVMMEHSLCFSRLLELTAIEEKGFEDKPSLKSRQEGNS